jgi:hypothetical protein
MRKEERCTLLVALTAYTYRKYNDAESAVRHAERCRAAFRALYDIPAAKAVIVKERRKRWEVFVNPDFVLEVGNANG